MTKPKERVVRTIVILLMLGASPLSVTYSFADMEDDQGNKMMQNDAKMFDSTQNEEFEVVLTEKIVNGKLEVQHYTLSDDISKEDMHSVSFEGEISSWVYVNYDAYHSGIIIFDGKVSKIGENLWGISVNDVLNPEEGDFNLKLGEKSNNSHVIEDESTQEKEFGYRVIFSGKVGEVDGENTFAISLVNSDFKNPEIGQNIKFLHIEELMMNSEKPILKDSHYSVL